MGLKQKLRIFASFPSIKLRRGDKLQTPGLCRDRYRPASCDRLRNFTVNPEEIRHASAPGIAHPRPAMTAEGAEIVNFLHRLRKPTAQRLLLVPFEDENHVGAPHQFLRQNL